MKSPKNIQASQVDPAAPQLFGRLGGVQHTCEPIPQMKRQLIAQGDGSDECKYYHVIQRWAIPGKNTSYEEWTLW